MLNFQKLKENLNIKPLLMQLSENPKLWDQLTARQDASGSPHKYTKCIFIRWAEEPTVKAAFEALHAVDYPAALSLPHAMTLASEVFDLTKASTLGRVLIVELAPGGAIAQHSDEGDYADHYERFHISLESEPGNLFLSETLDESGEYVHMKPGELWYFNHKARHMVFNHSNKPRLHLIVDAVAPLFRRERFQ